MSRYTCSLCGGDMDRTTGYSYMGEMIPFEGYGHVSGDEYRECVEGHGEMEKQEPISKLYLVPEIPAHPHHPSLRPKRA